MKQHIASATKPLNDQQRRSHHVRDKHRWDTMGVKKIAAMMVIALFCTLTLSGCEDFFDDVADLLRINGNDDAEAQDDTTRQRVSTRSMDSGTFRIVLDDDTDPSPTFEVKDGATIYTLRSDNASVSFESGGSERSFELDSSDVVIERPGNGNTGSVTFIFAN